MTNKETVDIPSGNTIEVKLINPVNFGPANISRFMAPPVPGLEMFESLPSLSFLLEHPSGRKLVWDLGIRKDYQNYAPKIAQYIPSTNYKIETSKDVSEILLDAGYSLDTIEAVIWSHWHWDHIGDPSTFPASTSLVVGQGFKAAFLPAAPKNPESALLESDYAGRELREISFSGFFIGGFAAFDYFNDGSFYLLDSPGHAIGHMCGLARTTTSPDSFVLLGGDVCHYPGIMRPSEKMPLPAEIEPDPFASTLSGYSFCPGHAFEELQHTRGRAPDQSLYDPTFGHDIPLAISTVGKLQALDCREDVFVILAHDAMIRDLVDHFPRSLNDWKERGLGKRARWAWLKDLETYFKRAGVLQSP